MSAYVQHVRQNWIVNIIKMKNIKILKYIYNNREPLIIMDISVVLYNYSKFYFIKEC
jgi:hypothetical protein